MAGVHPFSAQTSQEMHEKNRRGIVAFAEPRWKHVSREARELVARMVEVDPEERISAADALVHPWLIPQADPAPALPLCSPEGSQQQYHDVSFRTEDVKKTFGVMTFTPVTMLRPKKRESSASTDCGGLSCKQLQAKTDIKTERTERQLLVAAVANSNSSKVVKLEAKDASEDEADFDENDMSEQAGCYISRCAGTNKTLLQRPAEPQWTRSLTNRVPRTPGCSENKRLFEKPLTPEVHGQYLLDVARSSHSGEIIGPGVATHAGTAQYTEPIDEESESQFDQYGTARSHDSKASRSLRSGEEEKERKSSSRPPSDWRSALSRSIGTPKKTASLPTAIKKAELERRAKTIRSTLKNNI